MCEKCGALIGTKKHLVWLYEKLGPLAYTNPSLLIAKHSQLVSTAGADVARKKQTAVVEISDSMRILCPKCKCELNIRL
jgi:hydrogenase-4 component H